MPALICGSLAFDTIMVFPDRFRHHILPDKVHILNVSCLVPEIGREFDGSFTGQAFITTDQDDDQITAFHPGAIGFSHYNRVDETASPGTQNHRFDAASFAQRFQESFGYHY